MSKSDDFRECSNGPLPGSMESRAHFDEGGHEFALTRDDALEYLNWCEGRGLNVLGFDAWMPTRPGPTVINGGGFEGDASACRVAITGFPGDLVFNIWVET